MAKKNKKNKISFKININELALNQRKFTTSEIGRGCGTITPKNKKNPKHKQTRPNHYEY